MILTDLIMPDLSWRGKIAFLALVFGGVLVFIGASAMPRANQCGETPQQLSCAELVANGPGDNCYVTLTEYRASYKGYCYYSNDSETRMTDVYVPIYPAQAGDEPESQDLRILVHLFNAGSEEEFYERLKEPALTGVVWSQGCVAPADQAILDDYFPDMPFDQCLIVNVGGRVPNAGRSQLLMGFGAFLGVVGLVFFTSETVQYWRNKSQPHRNKNAPPAPPQLTPVG